MDHSKQLMDNVFCDMENSQGRGKLWQPLDSADNTYQDLDYSKCNEKPNLVFFFVLYCCKIEIRTYADVQRT